MGFFSKDEKPKLDPEFVKKDQVEKLETLTGLQILRQKLGAAEQSSGDRRLLERLKREGSGR